MTEVSKKTIGKGAAYVYIESVASMISGYLFWIIMSKISPTDIIGISSAVVSLAGIFTVVATIGIPTGVQRFLGKSFADQKIEDVKIFFKTSILIVSLAVLACTITVLLLKDWMYESFNIDFGLLLVAIFLIASSVTAQLFRSVFISCLKTKMLPPIMIGSSLAKIVISVILVLLGTGALGLTIGYTLNQILTSIFLGILLLTTIFKPLKNRSHPASLTGTLARYVQAVKDILSASIVFWIPFLITTVGSQLGPVVVFGYTGSNQAGVYFIALAIVTGLASIIYSLFTIALPALSAMHDGRKRFAWQTIRLSAIMVLPLSYTLIFFSDDILRLLGQDYVKGSLALEILLLSSLPTVVMYGVHTLVYSYGNYKQVLAIGLATSLPRTALYFLLVPLYGGIGAAIGYSAGSIIGLILSIIVAKKIHLQLFWKDLVLITVIPVSLALAFQYFEISYLLSIPLVLTISYILLFKIHVLLRSDIIYIFEILPYSFSQPLLNLWRVLKRK